jgi:IMP dehydrogenase
MEAKMSIRINQEALTFDDVLLVPDYADFLPKDASLTTQLTKNISLNLPVLSAAMDTVTEHRLAIALAQEGGIGIIHKNMSIEKQANEVTQVKKYESGVVKDPVTVSPNISIRELIELIADLPFSGVPVVSGKKLTGLVTSRDIRFATDLDQKISSIMTPKNKLITVKEKCKQSEILELLHEHRIEKILVVNDNFELKGLVTVKDIEKSKNKPNAAKDKLGRLRVGAAVGTGADSKDRIKALVEAQVDVLVVDTAHGHSKGVIDMVKWVKQNHKNIDVIAGNIATADAAIALAKAGADAVKVGIGPGSICTTRIISGIGMPQLTAISEVANALKKKNIPVIADGGIRYSGDVCKAIAAGAHSVMIGSMFAGTEEAPGDVILYQGRSYKSYRGMGSIGAMKKGSSDRYFQENTSVQNLIPEGIEGRVAYKGQLLAVLTQLAGGLRAGMGYTGCPSVDLLRTKAKFVKITSASMRESHVHDVMITKEAPNYQANK